MAQTPQHAEIALILNPIAKHFQRVLPRGLAVLSSYLLILVMMIIHAPRVFATQGEDVLDLAPLVLAVRDVTGQAVEILLYYGWPRQKRILHKRAAAGGTTSAASRPDHDGDLVPALKTLVGERTTR